MEPCHDERDSKCYFLVKVFSNLIKLKTYTYKIINYIEFADYTFSTWWNVLIKYLKREDGLMVSLSIDFIKTYTWTSAFDHFQEV